MIYSFGNCSKKWTAEGVVAQLVGGGGKSKIPLSKLYLLD